MDLPAPVTRVLLSRWFGALGIAVLTVLLGLFGYRMWKRMYDSSRELNISCFAFRDVNRNGRYDLGDRPYAGLEIVMTRPNGSTVSMSSNISGFTNFAMSARSLGAAVRSEGDHRIEVQPPPGWMLTSAEKQQVRRFRRLAGSPSGLVVEPTFNPVGVAPRLTVSGQIEPGATLMIEGPTGSAQPVPVAGDGSFSCETVRGAWTLTQTLRSGHRIVRRVEVADYPVVVSRPVELEQPPALSHRHRVDFDTLTQSDTLYEVPGGYGQLNWVNWVATHQKLYAGPGYINGTVSGEYLAYNSSGHPARIESERPFDVEGFYLGVAWPNAEKHEIVVRAWRGDQLVHDDRVRGSVHGPLWFASDYRSITRIEVASSAFWQVVMDDFSYRLGTP